MKHARRPLAQLLRVATLSTLLGMSLAHAADDYSDITQLLRAGKAQDALAKADQRISTNPRDPQLRFLRGVAQADIGKQTDAISTFTKLTEDYPELPEPYNNLAVLYANQNQLDKARTALEMAIRTNPAYATAHENLGDIYAKMASQAYDKALQLDKSNTSAQTKLSLIRDLFSPAPRALDAGKVADAGKPGKDKPTAKPTQIAQETAPATEPVRPKTETDASPVDKPGTGEEVRKDPKIEAGKSASTDKPAAKPKAPVNPRTEIEQTVRAWADAWSARDAEAYLAFYGQGFKVPDAREREAWREERKLRVTRPEYIKVGIEKLRIELRGDAATVRFQQRYESNILKNTDKKTLLMAREGQSWKIIEER